MIQSGNTWLIANGYLKYNGSGCPPMLGDDSLDNWEKASLASNDDLFAEKVSEVITHICQKQNQNIQITYNNERNESSITVGKESYCLPVMIILGYDFFDKHPICIVGDVGEREGLQGEKTLITRRDGVMMAKKVVCTKKKKNISEKVISILHSLYAQSADRVGVRLPIALCCDHQDVLIEERKYRSIDDYLRCNEISTINHLKLALGPFLSILSDVLSALGSLHAKGSSHNHISLDTIFYNENSQGCHGYVGRWNHLNSLNLSNPAILPPEEIKSRGTEPVIYPQRDMWGVALVILHKMLDLFEDTYLRDNQKTFSQIWTWRSIKGSVKGFSKEIFNVMCRNGDLAMQTRVYQGLEMLNIAIRLVEGKINKILKHPQHEKQKTAYLSLVQLLKDSLQESPTRPNALSAYRTILDIQDKSK